MVADCNARSTTSTSVEKHSTETIQFDTPVLETDGTGSSTKKRKITTEYKEVDLLDATNAVEDLDSMRPDTPNFDVE